MCVGLGGEEVGWWMRGTLVWLGLPVLLVIPAKRPQIETGFGPGRARLREMEGSRGRQLTAA